MRQWIFLVCLSLSYHLAAAVPETAHLSRLEQAWQQHPDNPEAALSLAEAYLEQALITDGTDYYQRAREVLKPWWEDVEGATKLHLLRAQLHIQRHHLHKARNDLQALQERHLSASELQKKLLLQARVERMLGNYEQSRQHCIAFGRHGNHTLRALCLSNTLSLMGRHEHAYALLKDMAYNSFSTDKRLYQWFRTEMAVLNHRFAQTKKAQENFDLALAQKLPNRYLWRHYGDFLLSQNAPETLLQALPAESQDVGVQLRRLLAMRRLQQDGSRVKQHILAQFQQAQAQDDKSLLLEEARFYLHVLDDPQTALARAQAAWQLRKAPDVAVIYLRAAQAAQQPQAAQGVLAWMQQHQWQDQALVELQAHFNTP